MRQWAAALAVILCTLPPGAAVAAEPAGYRHIVLDGHRLKWGAPEFGAGAVVTWALAPAPLRFEDARNCPGIAPLDPLLAENAVTPAAFTQALEGAFATWANVTNLDFRPAPAEIASILIGAQQTPRGRAYTNVEFEAAAAGGRPARLTRSVICLNPETGWKLGFDGNLDIYDLKHTLLHEIGHAIGLDHPGAADQLMWFSYTEEFEGLQPGDISGAVALYGAPVTTDIGPGDTPDTPLPASRDRLLALGE